MMVTPAHRIERQIALLEEYAANPDDQDVFKVAEEFRYLVGEQIADERRKEICASDEG